MLLMTLESIMSHQKLLTHNLLTLELVKIYP
jgi:hypothetical protein